MIVDSVYGKETTTTNERENAESANFNQMWFSNMGNPLLLLLLCNLVEMQLKVKVESPVMLTYALRS